MIDIADRPNTAPGNHHAKRTPLPAAPQGTLLYLVELARFETRYAGSYPGARNERRMVIDFSRTHAGLLRGVTVSDHQTAFVRQSNHPWDVLLAWIEQAMGKTAARV